MHPHGDAAAAGADNLDDSGRVRGGGCDLHRPDRPELFETARTTTGHPLGVEGARFLDERRAGIREMDQPKLHGDSAYRGPGSHRPSTPASDDDSLWGCKQAAMRTVMARSK